MRCRLDAFTPEALADKFIARRVCKLDSFTPDALPAVFARRALVPLGCAAAA